ncbi:glycosyl transferase [Phellopilus nigrolimitatus]|nr:glycosyl transferase [Phellopilus nigrolimitatus]
MSKSRFDYESLARLRKPAARPFRLFFAVVGIICMGTLFSSPRARDYVPYRYSVDDYYYTPAAPHGLSFPRPNAPVNVTISPALDPLTHRANATLFMLARNSELDGVEATVRSLEQSFNRKHRYPWVFLNEVPFTYEFKRRIRALTRADVHFGLIPSDHWYPPDWIDDERYEHDRKAMAALGDVPYAGSMTYRNMCRFNSGFFYHHELLAQFKWYWRVEPGVAYPCDIPFDPFAYMIENNKRYSFTITLEEWEETLPTLWDRTRDYMSEYSEYIAENNALPYITDDNGETYNKCYFYSNFEVADLDFFRSDAYLAYFNYLDVTGKFYYERWGDAPVHTVAAAMFLPRDQLHYFRDIGYYHAPYYNCPESPTSDQLRCECKPADSFPVVDPKANKCLKQFEALFSEKLAG